MGNILDNIKRLNAENREEDLNNIVSAVERAINSFSVNSGEITDEILEDDTGRQMFSMITYFWVMFGNMFSRSNIYDGRNEYSVKTTQKLCSFDSFSKQLECFKGMYVTDVSVFSDENIQGLVNHGSLFYTKRYMTMNGMNLDEPLSTAYLNCLYFVSKLCRTHRTLYQTFSKIVFHYLDKHNPAIQEMKEEGILTEKWYRCPLI